MLQSACLPAPFDAVVSAFAIHNVRSPERIRQIYSEIFPLVGEGGCFLNSEMVGAPGEVTRRLYRRERLLEMQERLKREKGIEKSLDELEKETQAGIPSPRGPGAPSLGQQISWLYEAGFDEVDCFWKEGGQAIFGGYRWTGSNQRNTL
ncbi:MAG: hypothetical protein HYX80_03050 [Chloroflexi bacterium]|nr:hypothetical protein [Chloroflexota bacterium]